MLTTEDMKKYHTTAERILNALDNSLYRSAGMKWTDAHYRALSPKN